MQSSCLGIIPLLRFHGFRCSLVDLVDPAQDECQKGGRGTWSLYLPILNSLHDLLVCVRGDINSGARALRQVPVPECAMCCSQGMTTSSLVAAASMSTSQPPPFPLVFLSCADAAVFGGSSRGELESGMSSWIIDEDDFQTTTTTTTTTYVLSYSPIVLRMALGRPRLLAFCVKIHMEMDTSLSMALQDFHLSCTSM